MIKDDMGLWMLDENEIKAYVVFFFSKVYIKEEGVYKPFPISSTFHVIEESKIQALRLAVDDKKSKMLFCSLQVLKAPRVDSLHALFYQSQWYVVEQLVCY